MDFKIFNYLYEGITKNSIENIDKFLEIENNEKIDKIALNINNIIINELNGKINEATKYLYRNISFQYYFYLLYDIMNYKIYELYDILIDRGFNPYNSKIENSQLSILEMIDYLNNEQDKYIFTNFINNIFENILNDKYKKIHRNIYYHILKQKNFNNNEKFELLLKYNFFKLDKDSLLTILDIVYVTDENLYKNIIIYLIKNRIVDNETILYLSIGRITLDNNIINNLLSNVSIDFFYKLFNDNDYIFIDLEKHNVKQFLNSFISKEKNNMLHLLKYSFNSKIKESLIKYLIDSIENFDSKILDDLNYLIKNSNIYDTNIKNILKKLFKNNYNDIINYKLLKLIKNIDNKIDREVDPSLSY